jgi:pimeloyl-ACP methyl ester carboxylesterase
MQQTPQTVRVPVTGGHLAVHLLNHAPAEAPVVLALHSISSNGLSWQPVADALDGELRVIAPDLRGRAESAVLRSRGLADHAADVVAVADHLGLRRPLLAGHSMGAFAAVLAGATYPERAAAVVLVDGGLALPAPGTQDIDAVLRSTIGPAMTRLGMAFTDEQAYLAYWRTHPGLRPHLDGPSGHYLRAFLLHDLAGPRGDMRSTSSLECVRADWGDLLADPATLSAIHALQCPAHLLWARRGPLDETPGLYSTERIAAALLPSDIATTELATNHYGALLDPAAVAAVGDALRGLSHLAA